MNHTPISTPGTDRGDRIICITENGRRRTVAHVYGRTSEERDERAAFFVLSANSHTELVTELHNILEWATTEKTALRDQEINSIRLVLAKAEGKP